MKISYIITGTSSGIGRSLAELVLLETEYQVLGIARRNIITHERYTHQLIDLSKTIQDRDLKVLESFVEHHKPQKLILVNNAGVVTPIGQIGSLSAHEIESAYFVNSISPFVLINALVALSVRENFAMKVLNIGTGASANPIDGWSTYCSTKAALKMLTEVAIKESTQKNWNIEFSEFSPEVIDTPMQAEIRKANSEQFPRIEQFIKFKSENVLESPETTAKKIFDILS